MRAQVTSKIEQAEMLVVQMDSVQSELESASDYEMFESCKAHLAGLKSDIEALGYQVQRCVNGWMLVQPVEAVATLATAEREQESSILFYAEDHLGLYAAVKSSARKSVYYVRICSKWLQTRTCDCQAGGHDRDCKHRVDVEAALRDIRPSFNDWVEGKGASLETIASLLYAGAEQTQAAA